ncbi:UNVERIFIED_CONTAM: hypothetical protein Sindi_2136900 [Sesamum indicum]
MANLKRNQRENTETSKSRQEQIKDALWNSFSFTLEGEGHRDSKAEVQRRSDYRIYKIYKIMEVTRVDLSDLQELAVFFQLVIVDLVNIQISEVTLALSPPEANTCSNDSPQDHSMRECGFPH